MNMEMTTGGIVFMVGAWIAILWLNGYCMYKVLGPGKPDDNRKK